jgi:hypothetical protein
LARGKLIQYSMSGALPLGVSVERSFHYFWNHFSFLYFLFSASYFSPRRNSPNVMKFSQSFKSQTNKIRGNKKFGTPSGTLGDPVLVFFAWGFHVHSSIATEWIKLENTHLPYPQRQVRQRNSTSVDGRLCGLSNIRRPVCEVSSEET